jgi:O-antigen/teichoic acid export membrane protein
VITKEKILQFFSSGSERSVLTKKNVLLTILIRIVGVPVSFMLIPLSMNYVNPDSYGVWITLSSIVAWMSFFDIGINNGLRNKLSQSLAEGNFALSRKYISTTYAILILISSFLLFMFSIINYNINWSRILNISSDYSSELSLIALVIFCYFCVKFIFSTINIILLSYQMAAQASYRGLIEQISSLVVIFLLSRFTSGSLLNLALALCLSPILILIYFNITLFRGKLKHISPSFRFVDFSVTKDLMGIGFKFFVIQIAGIIQFQTANFIIISQFGAKHVTEYNIVFKYFSVLSMVMALLMTPIWSAVTDAYTKKDYSWIIKIEKKFRAISFALVGLGFIMLITSSYAYDLWLGKERIQISFQISLFMYVWTSVSVVGSLYCTILNGISVLNEQFLASLFSPIVFISFSYLFITYFEMGVSGVILSSLLANFNAYILAPMQFKRIFYV